MTTLETWAAVATIASAVLTLAAFVAALVTIKFGRDSLQLAHDTIKEARRAEEASRLDERRRRLRESLEIVLEIYGPGFGSAEFLAIKRQALRLRLMPLVADEAGLPSVQALAGEGATDPEDGRKVIGGDPPAPTILNSALNEILGELGALPRVDDT